MQNRFLLKYFHTWFNQNNYVSHKYRQPKLNHSNYKPIKNPKSTDTCIVAF